MSVSNYKYLQPQSQWKPDFNNIDQTIVTIKIGSEAKDFHIHRELLCKASPYFESAFQGRFVEAQDRAITLDDVSTRTFEIVQRWLYSGVLVLPSDSDAYLHPKATDPRAKFCVDCEKLLSFDGMTHRNEDLLDIFVLADKYNLPLLRRETMITWQHLDEITHTCSDIQSICKIHDKLPASSVLCAYVADMYVCHWDPNFDDCPTCQSEDLACFTAENLPRSFMFKVMTKLHHNAANNVLAPGKIDWCEYHEHDGEEEMEACRAQRKLEGRIGADEYMDGMDT
ncbi:hypothetical protein FKW77_004101 [Venturia effusa]|uniref:BTB domain-containing protein n=1 Tax=Venturia effusa TaxID=50376 RepID=A0A517LAU0_9PEZI|nr:hypothetical protein FKW77_004101 [Venturia effusa]